MDLTAEQAELISDDPRRKASSSPFAALADFFRASREMHGLLTQAQAALLLGVSPGQVGSWVKRGRLSSHVVGGVRMVGGGEVAALLKERQSELPVGGRGHKAPSLSELVAASMAEYREREKE
jgi:predicted GNAT superfamily acetyltransferase